MSVFNLRRPKQSNEADISKRGLLDDKRVELLSHPRDSFLNGLRGYRSGGRYP
jgi:hypothetical protein